MQGPQRFGKYHVLGVLGRGGMGTVYRGRDPDLGREVAIKVFQGATLDPALRAEGLARFDREVDALVALRDPHVITIHARGQTPGGDPYLVMELIAGGSLREALRAGVFPEDRARGLLSCLAQTLARTHAAGVLHRDLKPDNVLLDPRGDPVLTDFGLAHVSNRKRLTQTGELLGTPAYMPPEQAAGERGELGPASDVYGLGALAYHLLTGQPPFRGGSLMAILHQVLEQPPTPPRALRPDLSPALEQVVLRCLAKRPADRYPDMQSLAAALEASVASGASRRRPWVAALGALGLVVAIGALAAARAASVGPGVGARLPRPTPFLRPSVVPSAPASPAELTTPGRDGVLAVQAALRAGTVSPADVPTWQERLRLARELLPVDPAPSSPAAEALALADVASASLICLRSPLERDPSRDLLNQGFVRRVGWDPERVVRCLDTNALAAQMYQRALDTRALRGEARARVGWALAQLGLFGRVGLDPERARKLLRDAASLPEANYTLAWDLWREGGASGEVLALLDASCEGRPDWLPALVARGFLAWTLAGGPAAPENPRLRACLEPLEARAESDLRLLAVRGVLRTAVGAFEAGESDLRAARELDPDWENLLAYQAQLYLGWAERGQVSAYRQLELRGLAVGRLVAQLRLEPGSTAALAGLGRALDQASLGLDRPREVVRLLIGRGHAQAALELIEVWSEGGQLGAELRLLRAIALRELQRFEESLAWHQQVAPGLDALDPTTRVRWRLEEARLRAARGEWSQALAPIDVALGDGQGEERAVWGTRLRALRGLVRWRLGEAAGLEELSACVTELRSPSSRVAAAQAALADGHLSEGLARAQAALVDQPAELAAWEALAAGLEAAGREPEAQEARAVIAAIGGSPR